LEPLLDVPLFLVSVAIISLSGVMMPGPVMAVTIAKGKSSGNAGALIALGHGVIEIPLMVSIYFGFAQFFAYEIVRRVIGFVGGFRDQGLRAEGLLDSFITHQLASLTTQ
jgi:threonine/homoserine/homoserine lactone efflux protein